MARIWTGIWAGGRTTVDRSDRPVWVLERMVLKRRYSKTLDAGNEDEALAELALFDRDPVGYVTKAQAASRAASLAAVMDEECIGRFLDYLKREGRTERYRKNVRFYLSQWADFYDERDVRLVPLQALLQELNRHPTARKSRITSLKSFTAYLREEEATLKIGDDPTVSLKVPPARPEKARRAMLGQKKGYEMRDIERLYRAINGWESKKYGWKGTHRVTEVQCVRDVVVLHAKYGMHGTEIERLANGECEIASLEGQGAIAGTIRFIHKSGRFHIISVDAQGLAAAQRLRARGSAPVDSYIRKVTARAAKSIGLTQDINLGALRHSFTTWARRCGKILSPSQSGVPLAAVAAVLGHQSPTTTSLYYDGTDTPDMIVLPIKLEHPEDPVPLQRNLKDRVGQAT